MPRSPTGYYAIVIVTMHRRAEGGLAMTYWAVAPVSPMEVTRGLTKDYKCVNVQRRDR